MKLIGQKSVTIPQLLGDMERKKDDKEKKETWALTKNGQTSAQLTLSMSKTKSTVRVHVSSRPHCEPPLI